MALRLDHVNIRTARLPVLRAFYVDVLGLREGPRPPFGHPGAWLYADEQPVVHLWLGTAQDTAPPSAGELEPQLSHFAFQGDDRAALLGRLKAASIAFEEKPLPGRDVVQVKLHDPDGNALHIDFPSGAATGATAPPASEELSCGQELAAATDIPRAWAALMLHVATNLDRHAAWVGNSDAAARSEHDGLLAVAGGYRDMAAAAERAAQLMSAQRDLPPVFHDPSRRDLARDRAWMAEKLALQRALAALLSSHAEASARVLAAWSDRY